MVKLKHTYIQVQQNGKPSYGGNQAWGQDATMRKYGCGVIAGADLLLYLSLHKKYSFGTGEFPNKTDTGNIEEKAYENFVQGMRRRYFPVIPCLGMPWWMLVLGLNRYFWKNRIPLLASFGVRDRNFTKRIRAMMAHDIPVILAIGPNFPLPIKRHKLAFYEKRGKKYQEVCKTTAHFVTITGISGEWLEISSWGRPYYICLQEYREYVRKHSCPLVSNIIYIRKRRVTR